MQLPISPSVIDAFSSVVLAVFTIVLALVTWLYYRQSKLQTEEMKKSRELKQEPYLKAGLKQSGPNSEIGFVNIGGGTAHDVSAEYWVENLEEYKREWGTPVHFPDEIYKIGLPIDDSPIGVTGMSEKIEQHLEDSDTLHVEWTYKDSRGEVFKHNQQFRILEELEKRSESTEFYTGNECNVEF